MGRLTSGQKMILLIAGGLVAVFLVGLLFGLGFELAGDMFRRPLAGPLKFDLR